MTGGLDMIPTDSHPNPLIDILRRLKVTIDGRFSLTVDAEDVMKSPHQVRYWSLWYEDDDWHHWPSNACGPLGELLEGIAWVYVDAREDVLASLQPLPPMHCRDENGRVWKLAPNMARKDRSQVTYRLVEPS